MTDKQTIAKSRHIITLDSVGLDLNPLKSHCVVYFNSLRTQIVLVSAK